ncbi:RNA-guided endonuclease TnpB family protein [Nocardia sp. NPDC004604]|uniref:RNA-guided endonuclease InsQ/TnpB family protein n=1 Tax=Nocardia sp. NPDC004604 TaxID=3157013 RepID=UPI0033B80DEF
MFGVTQRAYKYRFYPNEQQRQLLNRTFGCVRYVYNRALSERTAAWTNEHRRITYGQTSAMLTEWKSEPSVEWLNEVSCVPLQQTLRHLQKAFVAFWGRQSGYPRFKSRRRGKASAEFTRSGFRYRDGKLWLAKCQDPLRIVWSRPLPDGAEPSTVTVSRDRAGRWFVSMLVEDAAIGDLPKLQAAIGIDVGLTALVTLSTGEKIINPKFEKADRARLARAQRALSRKQIGSRNREKARIRMAKTSVRIADRRRDFAHKLTTRLVRENQTIVIEDLAVRNMRGSHRLARAISDAAWSQLRIMLEYKCRWYGRRLVIVDRWLPSSKTCGACGAIAESMPLSSREWTCHSCNTNHDRDINAARNILAAGLAVAACGDDVRPQRRQSGGQLSVKQENRPEKVGVPCR